MMRRARIVSGDLYGASLLLLFFDAVPAESLDERLWKVVWHEIRFSSIDAGGNAVIVEHRVFSPVRPLEFPLGFWTDGPRLINLVDLRATAEGRLALRVAEPASVSCFLTVQGATQ